MRSQIMSKILIVDDEPLIRQLLELTLEELEDEGVELLFAAAGDEGLKIIKDEVPCMVFFGRHDAEDEWL